VEKSNLAKIRAGYREVRRVLKFGPSYPWRRYVAPATILKTRAIHTDEAADVTVCVLTSRHDWLMCLWSLVSFYHFSGLTLPLLIYSDGSLKSTHTGRIREVFPNAKVVDPAGADTVVLKPLAAFPNCRKFRLAQPCARRIVDLPFLCKSKSILMLDSDIFFFKRPEELVKALNSDISGHFVFERDMQESYFDSRENIRKRFEINIAARVNCGIMVADIAEFDHSRIEKWLLHEPVEKHPWAEQTLWAMYAGETRTAFLGRSYDVSPDEQIERDALMKHYVKPIRDYLYMQGIPYLIRCLELAVH
jgi:hypothetical protein